MWLNSRPQSESRSNAPARPGPWKPALHSVQWAAGLMQTKAMTLDACYRDGGGQDRLLNYHLENCLRSWASVFGFRWVRNIFVLRQWGFSMHQLQQQTLLYKGVFYVTWKDIGYTKDMPESVRRSPPPNICSSLFLRKTYAQWNAKISGIQHKRFGWIFTPI